MRFGGPKQLAPLTPDERLVDRATSVVAEVADTVVVVLTPGHPWDGPPVDAVAPGGADRSASVSAGLAALDPAVEVVLVHDAAHPLASPALARAVVAAVVAGADAAVPFLEVADVVKRRADDGRLSTVGRHGLGLAQMPMAFRRSALESARVAGGRDAVEESAVVEAEGGVVVAVPGEAANVHVVDRATLDLARRLAGPPPGP